MRATLAAKLSSQPSLCSLALRLTNTVTPQPTNSASISATRFLMTPASSKSLIRRQQAFCDRFTPAAISATEREASSCKAARMAMSNPSRVIVGKVVIFPKYAAVEGGDWEKFPGKVKYSYRQVV